MSAVDHPSHYGGADNPYEAIKVIEAWKLGFNLGNAVKYVSRAGKKGSLIEDLEKAVWYLQREIDGMKAIVDAPWPHPDDEVRMAVRRGFTTSMQQVVAHTIDPKQKG
jgi:hypothetical protein